MKISDITRPGIRHALATGREITVFKHRTINQPDDWGFIDENGTYWTFLDDALAPCDEPEVLTIDDSDFYTSDDIDLNN